MEFLKNTNEISMLTARVKLFVDRLKPAAVNVGVDLGGGDVWMTEHDLDGPKIGTMFEKVGGEWMAQGVGADLFVDPGCK